MCDKEKETKKRKNLKKIKMTLTLTFSLTVSLTLSLAITINFTSKKVINNIVDSTINSYDIETQIVQSDGTIRNIETDDTVTNNVPDTIENIYDNIASVGFETESHVRLTNSENRKWKKSVNAEVGDEIEFRIQYKNTSNETQRNVAIKDVLQTNNLRYVSGSCVLKNSTYPKGATLLSDSIIENGISIGSYSPGANAFVYLKAEVVDVDLKKGTNVLKNWGQAGVEDITIQDFAEVIVEY